MTESVAFKVFKRNYEEAMKNIEILNNITLQLTEYLDKYRDIGTVGELRENKNFLEFLYNHIQPNEMEQYLAMYHASGEKGE